MQDTRSLYKQVGKPLSIGRKAGKVPGVYESGTEGNGPTPAQSPTRSGLTMVQATKPKAPTAPSSGLYAPVGSEDSPTPQINTPVSPRPAQGGSGGIMTMAGQTRVVAPTPAQPVASPTTANAQQTESANPLSGAGNQQAAGTTTAINPGAALGFSRRGSAAPAGIDAAPSMADNSSSIYNKNLAKPTRQQMIDQYVKRLFGNQDDSLVSTQ